MRPASMGSARSETRTNDIEASKGRRMLADGKLMSLGSGRSLV